MQEALSQACEKMTPVVRPVIVTCPFEGANLVFARIDEMLPRDKPCFTTALGPHGGSFIRTGDGDRRMTSYEVDRLIEEHLQPTYDLDIVPDATTDDLDPQLVAGLLARVREQHPRVFADRDGIDVLLDLQVLRHDDFRRVGGRRNPAPPPWPDCWRWAAIRRSSIRGSAFRLPCFRGRAGTMCSGVTNDWSPRSRWSVRFR